MWVDALANYISALGWGTEGEGSDALFQQFWPQKDIKSSEGNGASPEVIYHSYDWERDREQKPPFVLSDR